MPRCFSLPATLIACVLFFVGSLQRQVMSESLVVSADNTPPESPLESAEASNSSVPEAIATVPADTPEFEDNASPPISTERQGVPPQPAVVVEGAAASPCWSLHCPPASNNFPPGSMESLFNSLSASGSQAADAPIKGCPADPSRAFPALGRRPLLELLAVDIARRSLLAVHPKAAYFPIWTTEVLVRNQGHYVRTYVRLSWFRRDHPWGILRKPTKYEAEASASIIYHPERRRVSDLSYTDNACATFRNVDRASQVVATYNEKFNMLDDAGLTAHVLGDDIQVLQPARRQFLGWNLPLSPPHPREKSLRTVRTDGNVTANQ